MIRYCFFNDENVVAGFSERNGGVSPMPENSLNLSFSREPFGNRENVLENYRIACSQLGIGTDSVTRMSQVHGSDILTVRREHRGMGVTRDFDAALAAHGYDGMITDVPGITLSTTHADCTPVLLFDPVKRAAGAVHSGWKGTCLKISANAVKRMAEEFGSNPGDIKAIVGPSICMEHFEVRSDVYGQFCEAFKDVDECTLNSLIRGPEAGETHGNDPKWHVDMRGFVKLTLTLSGVKADNIFDDSACTFCLEDRFFSHRRDGKASGAMAAFICLRE